MRRDCGYWCKSEVNRAKCEVGGADGTTSSIESKVKCLKTEVNGTMCEVRVVMVRWMVLRVKQGLMK